METGFKLKHVTLYAKHWYKRSKKSTIWEDLKKCLTADGYNGEYMSDNDVVYILLNHFQKIKGKRCTDLIEFASGISKEGCWKHGYYTKDHYWMTGRNEELPEYNYHEAIVRYVLSSIRFMTKEELGIDTLPAPDYVNCLPRRNGIKDKVIREMFLTEK